MTFKEYLINEGKWGRMVAGGALMTNNLLGNFASDWSKYYQGTNNPEKEARAEQVLSQKYDIPEDAEKAIKVAVYIFTGDEGKSAEQIREYLEKTGVVESGYKTKVQKGGGPARSYWQVEPKTAMDLVKNSSAFFGSKFHKKFGKNALKVVQTWDEKKWSTALERYDSLAATMAAAKWLSTDW